MRRALAALLLGLAPGLAAAQSLCPGHVSTTAAGAIPRGATIDLILNDDGPREVAAREVVRDALRRAGWTVSAQPQVTLGWRGRADIRNPGGFSIEPERDRFADSDDFSWLGGAPHVVRRDPRTVPNIRVNAILEAREAATRRVLWTAIVSCDRHGTDDALVRYLTETLVPLIGRTVAGQRM